VEGVEGSGRSPTARRAADEDEGGTEGLLSVGILDTKDGSRLLVSIALFKPADRLRAVMRCRRGTASSRSTAEGALLKSLRFRNVELPAYELVACRRATLCRWPSSSRTDGAFQGCPRRPGPFRSRVAKKRFEARGERMNTKDGEVRIVFGDKTVALSRAATPCAQGCSFDGTPPGREVFDGGKPGEIVFKADGSFEDGGGLRASIRRRKPG